MDLGASEGAVLDRLGEEDFDWDPPLPLEDAPGIEDVEALR